MVRLPPAAAPLANPPSPSAHAQAASTPAHAPTRSDLPDDLRCCAGIARRAGGCPLPLANFTGAAVPITWLIRMDLQIADTWGSPTWPVDTYRDVLTELESRGDEFGLHTHLWRWDADVADWVTDHDPEWSGQCVSMAL